MIYLKNFTLPSYEVETSFLHPNVFIDGRSYFDPKNLSTMHTTKYPFGIFDNRDMPK